MRIIFFLIAALLLVPQAFAVTTSEYRVLALINIEREERGLVRLKMDSKLNEAAQVHASDMNRRKYFNHTSPSGDTMASRLHDAGAKYTTAGENIAYGYTTAVDVVAGWMNSPGHRANILNRSFRKVGISRVNNYWVQDFSD